jgi:uncharacterized membrane protein
MANACTMDTHLAQVMAGHALIALVVYALVKKLQTAPLLDVQTTDV